MEKRFIIFLICLIFVKSASAEAYKKYPLLPSHLEVNKVIMCIGDGMGLAQIMATRLKKYGAYGRLNIELMPVTGLCNTCSADALITDSGASATAFATGRKTKRYMIGTGPDGKGLPTILEICKSKGMATGLVATSTITHATPAAFAAHVTFRADESAIAEQLIANRVNVLLGGGEAFFLPRSDRRSKRQDNRDLIKEAINAGYKFVQNKAELLNIKDTLILGLFNTGHLVGDSQEPNLEQMTEKANF